MTMSQQDRQALQQNWDQAKSQIKSQFPDLSDDDLDESNPDQLISRVASVTGKDRSEVERQLSQVAQGFSGQTQSSQPGQSAAQRPSTQDRPR